jgi:hypothetical protein
MGTITWFTLHTHTTAIGTIARIITVGDRGKTLKLRNGGSAFMARRIVSLDARRGKDVQQLVALAGAEVTVPAL